MLHHTFVAKITKQITNQFVAILFTTLAIVIGSLNGAKPEQFINLDIYIILCMILLMNK